MLLVIKLYHYIVTSRTGMGLGGHRKFLPLAKTTKIAKFGLAFISSSCTFLIELNGLDVDRRK
jgi:hypothetical protein